jgi:dihydrofolate reductase
MSPAREEDAQGGLLDDAREGRGGRPAGQGRRRRLVDEFRLFVNPVVLGGGTPFFPALAGRIGLELVESRTIGSPVVYVRYRVRAAATTRQVIDSPSGAS